MVFSGAIAGGVANEIAGGKFWDGFRNGLISAGLNHAAHYTYGVIKTVSALKQMIRNHPEYTVTGKPTPTLKYIKDMINNFPLLKAFYELGGKPKVFVDSKSRRNPYYEDGVGITITEPALRSNFRLLSTLFHESYHGYQYTVTQNNGLTLAQKASYLGNLSNPLSKGTAFLEYGAYQFQYNLGDYSMSVQSGLAKYKNILGL